jgi:hypothetical protein
MTKTRSEAFDEQGRRVSAKSAYAHRIAELHDAHHAIGDTNASHLAWVVKFAGEDSHLWNAATERAYGNCITALARGGFPDFLVGGIRLPPPLESREVHAIHQAVKEMLKAAVQAKVGQLVPIPTVGLTMALVRVTEKGKKPAQWGVSYGSETASTAVLKRVADLVLAAGDRLVACKYCGGPIVSVKKQLFCNPFEAQKFRNDKREPKKVPQQRRKPHGKTTRTR